MFPYQKGDLCFHVPNTSDDQDIINSVVNANDLINNYDYHHDNYLTNNKIINSSTSISNTPNNTRKHWSTKSLANGEGNTTSNVNQGKIISVNDDIANKRVMHREIERQRRQEMANLFSSLRTILPLEYIKGKRSMSDHIFEATKYIKDLESNVKELGYKRDHLKKTCSSSISTKLEANVGCTSTNTPSSSKDGCNVSIHTFSKAIEIEICARLEEDPFPLSKVLKVLNEERLDVVSCVSSKVNKKWIYVIHCQVDEVASIDSCQLQRRLISVIN